MKNQNNSAKYSANILIRHPKYRELYAEIKRCQEESSGANDPRCMSLEGPTGIGKTALLFDFVKGFPLSETAEGTRIPVLYFDTPLPVTVNGLVQKMLSALGNPVTHKATQKSLQHRLIRLIKDCGVELVILDDFHDLDYIETEGSFAKVCDLLIALIKETGVPFLVVGTEGKVELILKTNNELSRLFVVREKLTKFQWDPEDPDTIQSFSYFIRELEEAVGLSLPWQPNNDLELLYRLHYATDGVIANIMILMRSACKVAERQGAERLDIDVLAAVYDKLLARRLNRPNPFNKSLDEQFIAL
ncbi:MAG: TniB family NTP-binding protein [Anaerolineae bacterium]|nr:TniB family NTP-binding protein [Anaerolineae bacterium]